MYPRTTHSTGSISSLRTVIARPRTSSGTPSVAETKWLATMWPVRPNQNAESPVSTAPLSGMGVGCTTSYVEIRSLATMRIRSPRSYISRTFPLARSGRSVTGGTIGRLATSPAGYARVVTVVLIVIILLAAIVAGWLAYRVVARRHAERERARERLSTEASGHRQELEASAVRARESTEAAEARFERAGEHRGEAERLHRQAAEHERLAEEEESAAQ